MTDQEKLMKLFGKQCKITAKVEKLRRKIAKQQQEEEKSQAIATIESLGLVYNEKIRGALQVRRIQIPPTLTPDQREQYAASLTESMDTQYACVDVVGVGTNKYVRFLVGKAEAVEVKRRGRRQ